MMPATVDLRFPTRHAGKSSEGGDAIRKNARGTRAAKQECEISQIHSSRVMDG